jgi:hypothetical protein
MTVQTSAMAQADNAPRSEAQQNRIVQALAQAGKTGLTSQEVEQATGIGGNSVRPAIVALRSAGAVTRTDRTRPTDTGSLARVLVLSGERRRAILEAALAWEYTEGEEKADAMVRLGWLVRAAGKLKITAAGWEVIAGCASS